MVCFLKLATTDETESLQSLKKGSGLVANWRSEMVLADCRVEGAKETHGVG